MTLRDQILSIPPLLRTRRNHALEHATLQVLTQKDPKRRLAGYSGPDGFWVLGEIDLETLQQGVEEAQTRLRAGERNLAVHPHCGTNFVTTGAVAGTFAWLGMLGTRRGLRDKLDRLPILMMLVTLAMIMAQPLGPRMQEKFTTEPDLGDLQVTQIMRYQRQNTPLHKVSTRSS